MTAAPPILLCMAPIKKNRPERGKHYLRQWREHREMSQEQAADLLKIDRTTLSKIERGLVPYNEDFIEAAALAYRCEPADLLRRDPESDASTIYDTLQALPAPERATIEKMVQSLKRAS